MDKRQLDDLRELHMEFASLAHLTGSMDSNSITDFFGWIYKQLGTRADAEMTGFRKGREQASKENPRVLTIEEYVAQENATNPRT